MGLGVRNIYIYIYYIQPKLRIGHCQFGSGKGAGLFQRERRGSSEKGKGAQHRSTAELELFQAAGSDYNSIN